MSEGLTLAGRYRLVTKLGQGGMGSVWRAEHLTLGIPVAVKLIDPLIAQSEEALARFRREAQAAAELRSAHVVHIIDYGVENNTPYIAMELLEGESLSERLERMGRLSPADTAAILSQVARALTRAHQQNIIHRDLKPENIFIVLEGEDEVVKVLDFGIAKKLGLGSTSNGVKTHTGAMLGTPYYMSPEQAKGQSGVDHRTDVWSLGIIAYECITGARPFDRETLASLLIAICTEPLPVPSQVAPVPVGFDTWFERVASRDLKERFQTANEAITKLREVCGVAGGARLLEITASPGVTPEHGLDLVDLANTGDPSAVTIGGARRKGLRGLGLIAGALLVLAVAGVLVSKLMTHRDNRSNNASASLILSASIDALPSNAPPIAALSVASPSPATPQSNAIAAASASAAVEVAAAIASSKTSKSTAGPPTASKEAKRSDASKGNSGVSVAASAANANGPTGKGTPRPVHRDYDKSVGF